MSESRQGALAPSNRGTAKIRSQNFRLDRRRKFFRVIAKHAYPTQTAYELRKLTKDRYGERTIYDWIAGRSDAPLWVFIRIMDDIFDD
jgi:hypothetical protein